MRLKTPGQNALIKHANESYDQFTSPLKIIAARNHFLGGNWPLLKDFCIGPSIDYMWPLIKAIHGAFCSSECELKISHGSLMSDKIW